MDRRRRLPRRPVQHRGVLLNAVRIRTSQPPVCRPAQLLRLHPFLQPPIPVGNVGRHRPDVDIERVHPRTGISNVQRRHAARQRCDRDQPVRNPVHREIDTASRHPGTVRHHPRCRNLAAARQRNQLLDDRTGRRRRFRSRPISGRRPHRPGRHPRPRNGDHDRHQRHLGRQHRRHLQRRRRSPARHRLQRPHLQLDHHRTLDQQLHLDNVGDLHAGHRHRQRTPGHRRRHHRQPLPAHP